MSSENKHQKKGYRGIITGEFGALKLSGLSGNPWVQFFMDNMRWMLAALIMAAGIWVIAVMQTNPIEQQDYSRPIRIETRLSEDMVLDGGLNVSSVTVKLRAPQSVWESLRSTQVHVIADFRGKGSGEQTVKLEAFLDDGVRGEVVEIDPPRVTATLVQIMETTIAVTPVVNPEPPAGYTYSQPVCEPAEVLARGQSLKLENLSINARLNLGEQRNPVTLDAYLLAVNATGQGVSGITLEPDRVTCTVNISQREDVTVLSVVPDVQGFPEVGYIYEGYDFEPRTVTVTGSARAIQSLNGVVKTEIILLDHASSSFERLVSVILPEGVELVPEHQDINVSITISTARSSRQFSEIPVQIENLPSGFSVRLLPETVTVFVVGPQPLLEVLNSRDLRVTVNLSHLSEPGDYQVSATTSISAEQLTAEITPDTSITVQPSAITITLTRLPDETLPAATISPDSENEQTATQDISLTPSPED